jgi:hypothetical protein|uniref:Uncharacterized protein n=1 Tax=Podoviridae sp. ctiuS14 TaxID=2827620 RepID=A0A8S5LMJ2_9CAUD|nr:MAG TPA: hypothetical protein [Podoviridae sp. ctiuS14]
MVVTEVSIGIHIVKESIKDPNKQASLLFLNPCFYILNWFMINTTIERNEDWYIPNGFILTKEVLTKLHQDCIKALKNEQEAKDLFPRESTDLTYYYHIAKLGLACEELLTNFDSDKTSVFKLYTL